MKFLHSIMFRILFFAVILIALAPDARAGGLGSSSNGTATVVIFPNSSASPVDFSATTSSLILPTGTTGQRPVAPITGEIRFNSTTGMFEAYSGGSWGSLATLQPINQGGSGATNASDALLAFAGEVNISVCGNTFKPLWCSGSDIGAWANAAFAASGGTFLKVIADPHQGTPYTHSTTGIVPPNVILDLQGSYLNWQSASGTAWDLGAMGISGYSNIAGIYNFHETYQSGYTSGNTNTCVYFGGNPADPINYALVAGNASASNFECTGFNNGVSYGNNAWSNTLQNPFLHGNNNNLFADFRLTGNITAFQIASNVVTFTMSSTGPINFTTGQKVTISGLSTGTYLNGQILQIASVSGGTQLTASFTHANASLTSDAGTATYGCTNCGEEMAVNDGKLFNSACGVNLNTNFDKWSLNTSRLDYNTAAVCGASMWLALNDVWMEQSTGPAINLTSTTQNSLITLSKTNTLLSSSSGSDNGYIRSLSGGNRIILDDAVFNSNHAVSYLVYTNGLSSANVSAKDILGSSTYGGLNIPLSDAATTNTAINSNTLTVGGNGDDVKISGSVNGTVSIAATGSDSNINLNLISKGTGAVQFNGAPLGSLAYLSTIPAPSTSTLGGVFAASGATSHQWMSYIDNTGAAHTLQPSFSDISGAASNAQIPAPTTGALGGLIALASSTAHQVVQYIDTSGVQHLAQLAFGDISGTASNAQIPAPTTGALGGLVALASSTAHQVVQYIDTSGVQHLAQLAFGDISGQASLASQVTGTLPVSNGGTGAVYGLQSYSTLESDQPTVSTSVAKLWQHFKALFQTAKDQVTSKLIVGVGDSTTEGVIIGAKNSWFNQLAATVMLGQHIPVNTNAWCGGGPYGGLSTTRDQIDTRITVGTDWALDSSDTTLGGAPWISSTHAGTPLTFNAMSSWNNGATVYYEVTPGGGSFTISDGVTSHTITDSGSNAAGNYTLVSNGYAPHKFTATNVTGTNHVLCLVSIDNTIKNLTFLNTGWSGMTSNNMVVATNPWSPLNMLGVLAPDFTTIDVLINDWNQGISTSTSSANLQSIISEAKLSGDALLIAPEPQNPTDGSFNVSIATQQQYTALLPPLAVSNNIPLYDIYSDWQSYSISTATPNLYADGIVHPSITGAGRIAAGIYSLLHFQSDGGSVTGNHYGTNVVAYGGLYQINSQNALWEDTHGNTIVGNSNASTTINWTGDPNGDSNTALGSAALNADTTGYSNTAIGTSALKVSTTGIQNTAIGQRALSRNTTGTSNTAIGSDALTANTTGQRNTVLGEEAGGVNSGPTGITTGSNNLILGYQVGSATLATGSSNILIGTSNAVDAATSSTNNELNVQNSIAGTLAGGTNPAICAVGMKCVLGQLRSANLNSTSDQAITIGPLTSGNINYVSAATKYKITEIYVANCSGSASTAKGAFYTATSKGGTIIGATTTPFTSCTSSTTLQTLTGLTNEDTSIFNAATLYLSLTTAQGSALTGDVYIIGMLLN